MWQEHWTGSSHARLYFKCQPKVSLKRLAWRSFLRDKDVSLFAAFRMNAPPLNKYRFGMNVSQSPLCECGEEEDVDHFLLQCPRYSIFREDLFKTFLDIYPRLCQMTTETLLYFDLPDQKLKLKLKAILKFVRATKRFK